MKLTLVITSLELGGAERTLASLANAWAARGEEITVVVFNHDQPSFPLHPAVRLHSLAVPNGRARNLWQAVSRNSRRIMRLRRKIRESRPDVVISFMDFTNVVTLLASVGTRLPVIVSEQANPDYVPMGRLWEVLRRVTYRFADRLVCPTQQMAARLEKRFKLQGRAIPNLVAMPPESGDLKPPVTTRQGYIAIAMGRLVPQKGFDLLLNAFSRIAKQRPEWSLVIVGKGPLRGQLEAQATSLGLAGRVKFAGELADPYIALRAADLFLFPSRFEGFGNALVEAMACGLPVISFDCAAGPADIIRQGVDGILIPAEDIDEFSAAMDRLMGDADERARLARRAPEVRTRFGEDRILAVWEELFEEIATGRDICPPTRARQETRAYRAPGS